ncbi:hypothetical protein [Microbacterium sp. NPDC055665]
MSTPSRLTRLAAGSTLLVALSVGAALPASADTTTPAPDTTETSSTSEITPRTIDPGVTDPEPSDPETTDPGTTDPGTSDPGTTDPGTTDPGTSDPGTSDPGTNPGTTDPGTADPVVESGDDSPTTAVSDTKRSTGGQRNGGAQPALAETGADTERAVLGGLGGVALLLAGLSAVFASRIKKPTVVDSTIA